jgi:hypothetical protein
MKNIFWYENFYSYKKHNLYTFLFLRITIKYRTKSNDAENNAISEEYKLMGKLFEMKRKYI